MNEEKDSFVVVAQEDKVKGQIYDYWIDANRCFKELTEQILRNPRGKESTLGREKDAFVASVLTLATSCLAKLDYQKDDASVQELRKIDIERFIYHPDELQLLMARHVFVLLTKFLEIHGITKTEVKDHVPKPFIRG
jgi:hypothetical protein